MALLAFPYARNHATSPVIESGGSQGPAKTCWVPFLFESKDPTDQSDPY
jgi:hypothetical protein